jgi:transcriptional regulator with XRE-family HTH domain
MIARIQLILKSKNLSSSQFADEIQVQRSSVSHILTGRNKPSLDFVSKILTSYPEINSDWLLFGKGQMIKNKEIDKISKIEEKPKKTLQSQILQKNDELNFDEEISENIKPEKKTVETKPEIKISSKSGRIEKIIVFYDDKSFEEFTRS